MEKTYTIIVYDVLDRQIMKGDVLTSPDVLASDVINRLDHMNVETHILFEGKDGIAKLGLVSRRRLQEVGLQALKAELTAFLKS